MKPVSVVIPTYNGRQLLEKNLPAVAKCLRDGDELIIIDDASTDDTLQWLKKFGETQKLSLKVITNDNNLRFAAAVNKGVAHATHPYIFLLNNDVSPEPTVLDHLLQHFSDPTVFAVGCREIEEHDGGVTGGKNTLRFKRGMFIHSRANEFGVGETAWASGGSAVFDREKWLQLKGFDPDYYPAYWEDVDLSFRARKRGWKVLFEPKAVVHHNHESTNADVFGQRKIQAISWRNAHRFVQKNGTVTQKLLNLLWRPYWWWKQRS